jgi:hypothetical protein
VFGLIILADFLARLWISDRPFRESLNPVTWADIAAIISFLAPLVGEPVGFLRILRTLRLLRSYQLLVRLRMDFAYFRNHEDVIIAITNLSVFIFVMTGFVYETQRMTNPAIGNYADALYFTVTALTTTGFGDITLPGTIGRIYHDLRCDAVLRAGPRDPASEQGALPMSGLRIVATRRRCRALQGLRADAEYPQRGVRLTASG